MVISNKCLFYRTIEHEVWLANQYEDNAVQTAEVIERENNVWVKPVFCVPLLVVPEIIA